MPWMPCNVLITFMVVLMPERVNCAQAEGAKARSKSKAVVRRFAIVNLDAGRRRLVTGLIVISVNRW